MKEDIGALIEETTTTEMSEEELADKAALKREDGAIVDIIEHEATRLSAK
jgi:hypothetical protein